MAQVPWNQRAGPVHERRKRVWGRIRRAVTGWARSRRTRAFVNAGRFIQGARQAVSRRKIFRRRVFKRRSLIKRGYPHFGRKGPGGF